MTATTEFISLRQDDAGTLGDWARFRVYIVGEAVERSSSLSELDGIMEQINLFRRAWAAGEDWAIDADLAATVLPMIVEDRDALKQDLDVTTEHRNLWLAGDTKYGWRDKSIDVQRQMYANEIADQQQRIADRNSLVATLEEVR